MGDPEFQKSEYDRISNWLLQESMLGHGLHEDFLIDSSHWFHQRIGRNNDCLADHFAAALDHHVALIFALPSVSSDAEAAGDLFDFLHYLVSWILQLPGELLHKSPDPLILVVGHRGVSDQFGAHIMERGGPSIIFWQPFSRVRKALGQLNYARLSDQICKTLVHEVIGHQLAFCSRAGPMITPAEIGEILCIADIDFIKLNDGSSLSARDFVRSSDLLTAVRRTEYIQSARHAHRYFGNLTELIAFAVEGVSDNLPYDYKSILRVLQRGLLREPQPVNAAGNRTPLYRSHDLSTQPFKQRYIYQADTQWIETDALHRNDHWLSLRDCQLLFQAHLVNPASANNEVTVLPRRSFSISLPFDGMALVIKEARILVSPLGSYILSGDSLERLPPQWQHQDCAIRGQLDQDDNGLLTLTNMGTDSMPVSFLRLNATTPDRDRSTTSALVIRQNI